MTSIALPAAIAIGAALHPDLTIPAAVYSVFMLFNGGAFAWAMSDRNGRKA